MNKNQRRSLARVTLLAVMTLTLCSGCAPIDGGELATFVREMLLNAVAAFVL